MNHISINIMLTISLCIFLKNELKTQDIFVHENGIIITI